jgi:hypothetical protein
MGKIIQKREKIKHIKIRNCIQCPYCKSEEGHICLKGSPFQGWTGISMGIIGRELDEEGFPNLPDWCPLEDYYIPQIKYAEPKVILDVMDKELGD